MDHSDYESVEPEAKRKKVRKGTRSCWACKRKKIRCTFSAATDTVCISCRQRGARCIGQDVPEELSRAEDNETRMDRFEVLLNHLVKKVDRTPGCDGLQSTSDKGQRPGLAASTPTSASEPTLLPSLHEPRLGRLPRGSVYAGTAHTAPGLRMSDSGMPTTARAVSRGASKYEKVSQALLAAFPSQKDLGILIVACSENTIFCHKIGLDPLVDQGHSVLNDATLATIPSACSHPVLIARQMLEIASLLQYISPQQHIHGLSVHHRTIMERLADAAIDLVTTSEELMGTMESLECIISEGYYHLNCGNIRRGWLAFRRALGSAQLMGIYRPYNSPVKRIDPTTNNIDPQSMWFRIVYMDRFLSILLGLPQGNADVSRECDSALGSGGDNDDVGAPTDRMERFHAGISARILERNQLGPFQHSFATTLEIDAELLKVTEDLPAKFWEPPSFAGLTKNSQEALWETWRVKDQMFHYTLVNQLHLPFLLSPSSERRCEYSRITCVNASREIMTRFITFRTFNSLSAPCRLVDFLALVAGMTLILAHLYSHRQKQAENFLLHQRLTDRATVALALENMENSSKLNEDMLAVRGAALLQQLLHIEADAARGQNPRPDKAQRIDSHPGAEHNVLLITVPSRGTIRIARDGISRIDTPRTASHQMHDREGHITIGGIGSLEITNHLPASDTEQPSTEPSTVLGDNREEWGISCSNPADSRLANPQNRDSGPVPNPDHLLSTAFVGDFMQEQDLHPAVAAGLDDWVFQGVDTAFFDNLMKGTNAQVGNGGEDTYWT